MAKILFVDEELFLKRSELLAKLSNKLEFQKKFHNSCDVKKCEIAKDRYVPSELFDLSIGYKLKRNISPEPNLV